MSKFKTIFKRLRKTPIFYLLIWAMIGALVFYGIKKSDFSYYFSDETDHIAVGYMLSHFGQKLYRDVTSIHQPLPILTGALIAKFLPFQTLWDLVSNLRSVMIILWWLGGVFLILRFRFVGLLAATFFASFGQSFFGFYLLPEATSFVPLIFLLLFLIENFTKKTFRPAYRQAGPAWWPRWLDFCLWGIFSFYLPFNLLGTAPFVMLSFILLIIFAKPTRQEIIIALSSGLICLGALFLLISPVDWYRETISNLQNYWLPFDHHATPTDYLTFIFYPFISLFGDWKNPLTRFWLMFNLLFIGQIIFLLVKKNWRRLGIFLLFYLLIVTLNLRVSAIGVTLWSGFHLLPFLITALAFIIAWWFLHHRQAWFIYPLFALMLINNSFGWLAKDDTRDSDYYINFSPLQDRATAINTLKNEGDTLLTGPEGYGFINMLTNLPFADRQNFHLDWSYRSPQLRSEFQTTLAEKPPTFIYFIDDGGSFKHDIDIALSNDYVPLRGFENSETSLSIYRPAAEKISEEKWQTYQSFGFTKPEINK